MAANPSVKNAALWAARLLLGGTFVYAAITKLTDPAAFAQDIDHYAVVPYSVALAGSVFLPGLELICGAAVILRWRERGALVLVLGLCGIFGVALASAMWRGLDINCGCFGPGPENSSLIPALVRDVGLAIIALLLLRNGYGSQSEIRSVAQHAASK